MALPRISVRFLVTEHISETHGAISFIPHIYLSRGVDICLLGVMTSRPKYLYLF